jgi:hypothetical protein
MAIDEQDRAIGACICGGIWRLRGESVDSSAGRWLDFLRLRCPGCTTTRTFAFDITEFFEPRPSVWSRRQAWAAPGPAPVRAT